MKTKQVNAGYRIVLSLALSLLVSALAFLALMALPIDAASGFPSCDGGSAPSPPASGPDVITITGTIDDENGMPVECVQVFAFRGATQFFTYTHSTGNFTLTMSAGTYDVVFNPLPGSKLASQSLRSVHNSQKFNITLPPGHAISGTVFSDTATLTPVGNVAIFAFNKNTFDGFGLPPTHPTSGTFQISLEPSEWELTFTPPPFSGFGPTQTTISLTDDITQNIFLQPGFTAFGTVMSGTVEVPDVEIFAQDPSQPNGYGFSPTDQTGAYTGTLPSGTYDILYFAPPNLGLGSTVVTNISGPPDVPLNVMLPPGFTVSGTVRCGGGLANAFVFATPEPPISAGFFGGWGRFAGADGFYTLTLQPGVYTFTISPPGGSTLPQRIIPNVEVQQDLTLDVDFNCRFLPIIVKE